MGLDQRESLEDMPEIRKFRSSDETAVLALVKAYAAFEGETSQADLAIAGYFPKGSGSRKKLVELLAMLTVTSKMQLKAYCGNAARRGLPTWPVWRSIQDIVGKE